MGSVRATSTPLPGTTPAGSLEALGWLPAGLLYDQLGRLTDEDARERTVRMLQGRFHADRAQATRVADTTRGERNGDNNAGCLRWRRRRTGPPKGLASSRPENGLGRMRILRQAIYFGVRMT